MRISEVEVLQIKFDIYKITDKDMIIEVTNNMTSEYDIGTDVVENEVNDELVLN